MSTFAHRFCLPSGLLSVCLVAAGVPAPLPAQDQPAVTREALQQALVDLKRLADKARAAKLDPLYADAILMAGPDFTDKQWDAVKDENQRADWAAFLNRRIRAETAQLTAALAAQKDSRVIPPVPDYAQCVWKDNYLTLGGKPVLIITANNSGGGPADPRLAGPGDLYGIVPAVGATRWDYQSTPIWPLYQKDPLSHRVHRVDNVAEFGRLSGHQQKGAD